MKATPFKALTSYGSYFQCYSYEGLSELPDKEFAIYLAANYGIATIPVSAFYKDAEDNKVLRFCFSKKEETLKKAVEKLAGLPV
jgi:methionine aminotransferase